MFNISLGEVAMVAVVGLLVLKPQDIGKLFKQLKAVQRRAIAWKSSVLREFTNESIIDLEGNEQKTYTLDQIEDLIKNERK